MNRSSAYLFHGGEIVTLDPSRDGVEALLVHGREIAALGSLAEVRSFLDGGDGSRGARVEEIDLGGKSLVPSLKDHHLHLTAIGTALLNENEDDRIFLDLAGTPSSTEIVDRVVARAAATSPGNWILGMGWNQHDWDTHELPTHQALSAAVPDHPVFLVRTDAHAAWVNAAALEAAHIDAGTDEPHGGAILRLARGAPSGMLLERAVEPVLAAMPESPGWETQEAFSQAAECLARQGVTEVFDAGFMASPAMVSMGVNFELYLELLQWADAERELPVRVNLMIPAPSPLADKITADPDAYRELSPRLGVTHIKLYADGAFGSRGAALSHPYADDPTTRGLLRMTDEELEQQTRRAIGCGLDISTHAIGDLAVTKTLDVYETICREHPGANPRRFRIEHFSYASDADIQRAAELGFLIVAQPNFIDPDDAGLAMEDWRVGSDNCRRAYPWRTLSELGAALAGSSDYYRKPGPPLLDFYVAHTRKNVGGGPADGWQRQERLSREESLRLVSTLYAPGGEDCRGAELREGDAADLAILSANPLTVDEDEIIQIRVHATVRAGEVVYHDGRLDGLGRR